MGEYMDAASTAALAARRHRAAEQLVCEQVAVQTFADLPAPSLKQKMAAAHYELSSSASPVAIIRALRA
ncbi:MAG: hypothetical protein EOS03_12430 [Mesorhizobium sp.]|uniref:hypothetical protein n=1 Tax=Mesorhizobium sp. TaxID=1871066 RepID=UPI000FE47053|nr:hypothetical protein [Mesorhizobium sp.]RWN20378.1 MAG: hypothetical protein EOR94_13280 [Mesorhizobium sp.]RWN47158.1 MAG: hypothetical protein EOS03_12430 [Mesorhizobium sp.]